MPRMKTKLQWIASGSARRATLKKRRVSLMKKASEMSTLCGVDVGVVVYADGRPEPEVWPPAPEEARRVAERFNAVPELARRERMMDQEGFLRELVDGMKEKVARFERENRERETELQLFEALAGGRPGLEGVAAEELVNLGQAAAERLRDVSRRIDGVDPAAGADADQRPATLLDSGAYVDWRLRPASSSAPVVDGGADMDQRPATVVPLLEWRPDPASYAPLVDVAGMGQQPATVVPLLEWRPDPDMEQRPATTVVPMLEWCPDPAPLLDVGQHGWHMENPLMEVVAPYTGGFGSDMERWACQGSSSSFPPM